MIRQATQEDIPAIVDMTKAMLEELGDEYTESHVVNLVVLSYRIAPCFLLLKGGIICGMAGLSLRFSPFSGQATLIDYGFYIQPRHRSYSLFSGLIEECKKYANKVGLPLSMNLQANIPNKVKETLFKRKGFKVVSMIGEYVNE